MFVEQFLGIGEGCLRDVATAEHLRYLLDALWLAELSHLRDGAMVGLLLQHL